jgi:hypothetical protein
MANTIFRVDEVPISYKGPCAHCGATATKEDAAKALHDWDKLLDKCVCCGDPIRIISAEIEHYAASEAAPYHHWGLRHHQVQNHTYWSGHFSGGFVDLKAHVACAIRATPHAKWPDAARKEAGVAP